MATTTYASVGQRTTAVAASAPKRKGIVNTGLMPHAKPQPVFTRPKKR